MGTKPHNVASMSVVEEELKTSAKRRETGKE
jgi:hypothetical protein